MSFSILFTNVAGSGSGVPFTRCAKFRFLQGELRKTAIQADQKPREDPNTRLVQILEAGKMNDHLSSKFHLII